MSKSSFPPERRMLTIGWDNYLGQVEKRVEPKCVGWGDFIALQESIMALTSFFSVVRVVICCRRALHRYWFYEYAHSEVAVLRCNSKNFPPSCILSAISRSLGRRCLRAPCRGLRRSPDHSARESADTWRIPLYTPTVRVGETRRILGETRRRLGESRGAGGSRGESGGGGGGRGE